MTDYLALLLEEQREEEKDRAETGTWETGAVRVPVPRREVETEEEWEWAEKERIAQLARQAVRAANETEAAASGEARSDGLDWTTRRWAAGELEAVQAGLRTAEPTEQVQLGRQVGESPVRMGRSAVGGEEASGQSAAVSGAGWLDRAVRVSLEGLPQPEQEPKVVTLEPGTADQSARRLELRQLDRLVRRDARRFDGGFQLL